MAVISYEDTKFDKFVDGLINFPFVRVALFSVIAGIVFHLLGMSVISMVCFYIIPLAITARIASFCLGWAEHLLTKFWATSLFVAAESGLVSMALRALEEVGGSVGEVAGVALPIIASIAWWALVLAGIGFLIRIFIAFFIR